jgi:hypothetical protein
MPTNAFYSPLTKWDVNMQNNIFVGIAGLATAFLVFEMLKATITFAVTGLILGGSFIENISYDSN